MKVVGLNPTMSPKQKNYEIMGKDNKDKIKRKCREEDHLLPKKWYAYPGINGKKFKPTPGRGLGISKLSKLVTKNANRSVIKGVRQKAKIEIIENINETIN